MRRATFIPYSTCTRSTGKSLKMSISGTDASNCMLLGRFVSWKPSGRDLRSLASSSERRFSRFYTDRYPENGLSQILILNGFTLGAYGNSSMVPRCGSAHHSEEATVNSSQAVLKASSSFEALHFLQQGCSPLFRHKRRVARPCATMIGAIVLLGHLRKRSSRSQKTDTFYPAHP